MFEMLAAWGQGCVSCSAPIESTRPGLEGRLCGRCRQDLPTRLGRVEGPGFVDDAWCLGPYAGLLGGLVRSAKYGGREDVLVELGRVLAERAACSPLVLGRGTHAGFAALTTVPSSRAHRLERGFDAVELLAARLPAALSVPARGALARRGGAPQAGQTHAERGRNVRGVYRARGAVTGRWLLVDDVMTTGATASACALALREAGADAVDLLVVAAASGVRTS